MYLIWRRDSTAKGAKKNTPSNVIRLQYITHTNEHTEVGIRKSFQLQWHKENFQKKTFQNCKNSIIS